MEGVVLGVGLEVRVVVPLLGVEGLEDLPPGVVLGVGVVHTAHL